ncbi:hypothetical protein [Sandaracinus amylolyticus]|uniref:hypothetical protein n=1 Tax=Sandaracinus amylolyticus TaxID=927083 RepID=UPI001F32E0E8|nr:hypothetical protein [Sandaracinus amylolyticus]UJR84266.1 Hypothetical protein I5071_63430 [Sandaracinus amylolyticus]
MNVPAILWVYAAALLAGCGANAGRTEERLDQSGSCQIDIEREHFDRFCRGDEQSLSDADYDSALNQLLSLGHGCFQWNLRENECGVSIEALARVAAREPDCATLAGEVACVSLYRMGRPFVLARMTSDPEYRRIQDLAAGSCDCEPSVRELSDTNP